jgi:hypothetical protein
MGENIKLKEHWSSADALREQIRHTEGDITRTVYTLEQRLSPGNLRQRGVRKAQRFAWHTTANLLDFAQRTPVQASLIGIGGSALWLLIRNRKADHLGAKKSIVVPERSRRATVHKGGAALKAAEATGLWMLLRKGKEKGTYLAETPAKGPSVSRVALAATATKAFLNGLRSSRKSGTTRPGRKVAWRALASAIGAAFGSYWYSHKEHRVR